MLVGTGVRAIDQLHVHIPEEILRLQVDPRSLGVISSGIIL